MEQGEGRETWTLAVVSRCRGGAWISGAEARGWGFNLERTSCPSSLPLFGLSDPPPFSTLFPLFPHIKRPVPLDLGTKDDRKLRGQGQANTELPREHSTELLQLLFNKMTASSSEALQKESFHEIASHPLVRGLMANNG